MHHDGDDYWSAVRRDRAEALEVVRRCRTSGLTPLAVMEELILPTQERISDLVRCGEWSAEEERSATAVNQGLAYGLTTFSQDVGGGATLVVVSSLPGEPHALPALVLAESLGVAGYRVAFVGHDPEPGDLLRTVLTLKPRAVLCCGSHSSALACLKALVGHVRAIGIPVVASGPAFGGPARAYAVGATAYAATAEEAVVVLDALPARIPPVTPSDLSQAEVEAAWILLCRADITAYAVQALRAPGLARRVDELLGCLASALATGDETILDEARAELAAEPQADRLWEQVGRAMRGHPLARVYLAGAARPGATPEVPARNGTSDPGLVHLRP